MTKSKFKKYLLLMIVFAILGGCRSNVKNVERPEKILSKRQIVYDTETYKKLADLWSEYYENFPSEEAYANWMYAYRYAKLPDYEDLLYDGLEKYPANPTLMYLTALVKQNSKDGLESLHLLERAAKLDPDFLDPWFSLVVNYIQNDETEKMDVALKHILEKGGIAEEIMDYNYNVLSLLEKDAILITNGDNDTYPGWILTRIVNFRPDITIVNRFLLNTEWYPLQLMKAGLPEFITQENLSSLRTDISNKIKNGEMKAPLTGPFSDTLLTYIIKSNSIENRPIYLSATLYNTEAIERYRKDGRDLGFVNLAIPTTKPYSAQIEELTDTWLTKFRTAGLNSWRLKYGNESFAGKFIIINYSASFIQLMDQFIRFVPGRRLELFRWYKNNLMDLIPSKNIDEINKAWCKSIDIKEIYDWCKRKNYIE